MDCSEIIAKLNIGFYVRFDKRHQPIVKFRGLGEGFHYMIGLLLFFTRMKKKNEINNAIFLYFIQLSLGIEVY